MRIALPICCGLLVVCGLTVPVQGDIVVFTVPTTKVKFVLQGKALESRNKPTVNFTHTASKQTFDLPKGNDTEVITLLPINQIATKKIVKAKGDEAALREAAVWCLDHGLLVEFQRAMDQLTTLNSSETFAVEAKRIKEELAKPVADMAAVEAELMKDYGGSTGKVVKSAHFVLVSTGEKADKSEVKRKRPEARVEQLEQFLQIFLMKCAERGLTVQVPTTPLKVAVVTSIPKKLRPDSKAGGRLDKNIFWSAGENVLFIDERSNVVSLDAIKKLQNDVTKQAAQPKSRRGGNNQPGGNPAGAGGGGSDPLANLSTGDLSRLTVTLQSLMAIGVDSFEWESISREAAYMLMANCGLTTRETPRWAQDGLAAYFEFPAEMGGVKLGDLGQIRNAWYQASLNDPDRITVDDIISGRCYEDPSKNSTMRATTQAWALMHYLLQKRPEGVATYFSSFRSMPPDVVVGEDVLSTIFDKAFDSDRAGLEEAWRSHMGELKADYLALQEEDGAAAPAAEN